MNAKKRGNIVPSSVVDKKLYIAVRKMVKKKVKVWPSAYASGQVVKEYKRRGGRYKKAVKKKKPVKKKKAVTRRNTRRNTRSRRVNYFGLIEKNLSGMDYYIPGSDSSTYYNPSVMNCLSMFYNKPVYRK